MNAINQSRVLLEGLEVELKTMTKKHYIVSSCGDIGYISNICTCDDCKFRGLAEIIIYDLDGQYSNCLTANDDYFKDIIYFGESLVDAVKALIGSKDKSKEVCYLQSLIDFYSKEMVK